MGFAIQSLAFRAAASPAPVVVQCAHWHGEREALVQIYVASKARKAISLIPMLFAAVGLLVGLAGLEMGLAPGSYPRVLFAVAGLCGGLVGVSFGFITKLLVAPLARCSQSTERLCEDITRALGEYLQERGATGSQWTAQQLRQKTSMLSLDWKLAAGLVG